MTAGNLFTKRAARLNNPDRLKELRPGEFLTRVAGVKAGMVCVDLGCGTGIFTLPMAEIVGPAGRVYAVDSNPEMLESVAAHSQGPQLTLVQADAASTGIAAGSTNVCLVALVMHEVASPSQLLAEGFRLLVPGGVLAIIEWKIESPGGPPPEIRIGGDRARELLASAGFAADSYHDWSVNHYALTGKKPR